MSGSTLVEPTRDVVDVIPSFDDMPFSCSNLLRGVYAYGLERPSWIQQRLIGLMSKGFNVIAQAPSGTGKSVALAIGVLNRVHFTLDATRCPQALMIVPSRELAEQVGRVMNALGEYLVQGSPFQSACAVFVGGSSVSQDVRLLKSRTFPIVVGTPGRLADMLKRSALRCDAVDLVVFDEADTFTPTTRELRDDVLSHMPKAVQTVFVSTTFDDGALRMCRSFANDPVLVYVPTTGSSDDEGVTRDVATTDAGSSVVVSNPFSSAVRVPEHLKLFYVAVEDEFKTETLMDLYESLTISQSMVFAETPRRVDYLAETLNKSNHTCCFLHSDMLMGDRDKVMSTFRTGSCRLLLTTFALSRGVDIHHCNIVVLFDMPKVLATFVHSVGRAGRYGRKAVVICLASEAELRVLREHEAMLGMPATEELPMDFATHLA